MFTASATTCENAAFDLNHDHAVHLQRGGDGRHAHDDDGGDHYHANNHAQTKLTTKPITAMAMASLS